MFTIFRANSTGGATNEIKIDGTHLLFDVFKPSTSGDKDTADGVPLFCCEAFRPLRQLRSVSDHTLWEFAEAMSRVAIPAQPPYFTSFMVAILSTLLDDAVYIVEYQQFMNAESKGRRYFIPHAKPEDGYIEMPEYMLMERERMGEFSMCWTYIKIRCPCHSYAGMFTMLRLFMKVEKKVAEVPAVKRKPVHAWRHVHSRGEGAVVKVKRDDGDREVRNEIEDWMFSEG